MTDFNPYAPPASDVSYGASGPNRTEGAWRDGDRLVVQTMGCELPDRCVVCNGPARGYRLKKTFFWHSPAVYLTLLIGALIYVILAAIVRKKVTVGLGLCEEHRARRRTGLLVGWLGFLGSFVLMVVGIATSSPPILILPAVLGMIGLPIAGMLLARVAYPTKIDDRYAWLKVGQPFLDSLPGL
jgi:hypothetical protein